MLIIFLVLAYLSPVMWFRLALWLPTLALALCGVKVVRRT